VSLSKNFLFALLPFFAANYTDAQYAAAEL
jgi:hypothetical protein